LQDVVENAFASSVSVNLASERVACATPSCPPPSSPPEDVSDDLSETLESFQQSTLDEKIWSTLTNVNDGKGLSRTDLESILDLLGLVSSRGAVPSVTTLNEWDKIQKKIMESSTSIVTPKYSVDIIVDNSDVPGLRDRKVTVTFYYENMEHFLRMEFKNPAYRGHFVKHSQVLEINGKRYAFIDYSLSYTSRLTVQPLYFAGCMVSHIKVNCGSGTSSV
jgi:hypothetical protein